MKSVDMRVSFAGLELKNPVVVASGTFGFGREFDEFYDISALGGICCKGLTLHPREGNPPPRIAETPAGILNSVGLQNPGVDGFIAHELPWLREKNLRIIANISGNTPEEYGEMCAKLADAGADAVSLINTIRGMRIDVNSRRPVLHMNTGGLSGPAVLPVAVRMVWEVAQAVKIPILGMGGVAKAEDAAQLMLAGASLVAVGTACFADPFAPVKVIEGLEALCQRQGLSRVSELTGAVVPW